MLRAAGSDSYQRKPREEARQGSAVGANRRSSLVSLAPTHRAGVFCAGFSQVITAFAQLCAKPDLPVCCVLSSPD